MISSEKTVIAIVRQRILASTGLAFGLLAGVVTAIAQTQLEEIVVKTNSNTRNFVNPDVKVMGSQQLLTTPTPITVIDPERFNLDTTNYTNTRYELMQRVPGMTNVRNLRIPCGWCDYTVNLQNGMATRALGRGNFNFDLANNFDIERIEIIKGPASALYPSHAFGGVINIITKKPPQQPTLRLFSDFGSWDRLRLGADFGFTIDPTLVQNWRLGSLGVKANISHFEEDGWREWRGTEKNTASLRTSWKPREGTRIEFGGTRTKYYKENPGDLTEDQFRADWGGVGTKRNHTPYIDYRRSANLDARLVQTFDWGGELLLPWGYVYEKTSNRWGRNRTKRHDFKPRYTHNFEFLRTKLIVGTDFSYSRLKSLNRNQLTRAYITSPYAQVEVSPFEGHDWLNGIKLFSGVRYEYTKYDHINYQTPSASGKKSFSKATPHVGITWQWNSANSVWFSYSQGYSVPKTRDLWSTRNDTLDNPNLKPEEAENFEIGARGSLFEDRIIYDLSWHHTTIKNFIVKEEVAAGVYQYLNAAKLRNKGLEAQIGLWPVKWVGVEAAYTYALNKYVSYQGIDRRGASFDYSGNYMYASPKHHLNARFIVKPIEGAKIELEWDHISKYYIDNANTGTYKRPDLFHLSASYKWNDFFTVWAQVRNLTDKKYANRVSLSGRTKYYRTGLPRSFAIGLSVTARF